MNHPSTSPHIRICLSSMMQKKLHKAHLESGTPMPDLVIPALTDLGIAAEAIRVEGSTTVIVQLHGEAALATFNDSGPDLSPVMLIDQILLGHLTQAQPTFAGIV